MRKNSTPDGVRKDGRWASCNHKGKVGEELAAGSLRAVFPAAKAHGMERQRRTGHEGPDVEGTDYWVEVERSAKPRPFRKYAQAIHARGAAKDNRPVLVVSTRVGSVPGWDTVAVGKTLVTMTMETFLELQAEAKRAEDVIRGFCGTPE